MSYPSSSHYTRNWDKLVAEIKEEEKDEKLEGDAALNQLFQQIYSDGNDEVKKAMNKSFVSISGPVSFQLCEFNTIRNNSFEIDFRFIIENISLYNLERWFKPFPGRSCICKQTGFEGFAEIMF